MNSHSSSGHVRILVEGPTACFRRPEFTENLITYDAMPPTVAVRLLASAYPLHNGSWNITRITVLNPIVTAWQNLQTSKGRRRVLTLKDVAYVIEACSSPAPSFEQASRASFQDDGITIHLGLADFGGRATLLWDDERPAAQLEGTLDLGWMLHSTERGRPDRFFRAVMVDGVLDLTKLNPAELAS